MRFVFLGAPGCGKGTLAGYVVKENSYIHISTGEILRQNIAQNTPVGNMAKSFIDKGLFVPDEIVFELLKQKLSQVDTQNLIFDGFPRNLAQAQELEKIISVDKVVYIDTDYDTILKRVSGRRVCTDCGKIFNIHSYGKIECDNCGGILMQRTDDSEDIVKKRFVVFEQQTKPLIDFYKQQNKFFVLKSCESPFETYQSFQNLFLEGK